VRTGTYKQSEVHKEWFVIDAEHAVVGRLAAEVAKILKGKHKPSYMPYLDCGDNVIIINADKVHFTGLKCDLQNGKMYHYHTGFVGGLKTRSAGDILSGKYPERVLKMAILRMLKKTAQREKLMGNLRLYAGAHHPHAGQNPVVFDFASLNPKNIKRVQKL